MPSVGPRRNVIERPWRVLFRRATHHRRFDHVKGLRRAIRTRLCAFQAVRSRVWSLVATCSTRPASRDTSAGPGITVLQDGFPVPGNTLAVAVAPEADLFETHVQGLDCKLEAFRIRAGFKGRGLAIVVSQSLASSNVFKISINATSLPGNLGVASVPDIECEQVHPPRRLFPLLAGPGLSGFQGDPLQALLNPECRAFEPVR